MALEVRCECGRHVKVKDELAGKRIRCPECKNPLEVPSARTPAGKKPAPVNDTLRRGSPPPLKAKQRPRDDDDDRADEVPVKAKKRPPDEDEDDLNDDAPPRAKKRRSDRNEDDDLPRSKKRRRRDEDDDPDDDRRAPKKKSKALLFAAIGGVVLLLGIGLGVYFLAGGSPRTPPAGPGTDAKGPGGGTANPPGGAAPQTVVMTRHSRLTPEGAILNSVTFSKDAKTLFFGQEQGFLMRLDVETGKKVKGHSPHQRGYIALAVSPDAKVLAGGARAYPGVNLFDAATLRQTHVLLADQQSVTALDFSSDGKWLASGGQNSTVKVWDMGTRTEAASFPGHDMTVSAVRFSPDGKTLAAGSFGSVHFWDLATKKLRGKKTFDRHYVNQVDFSPDSRLVVASTNNEQETRAVPDIRIWETESLSEKSKLPGLKESPSLVAFLDNQTLAYATNTPQEPEVRVRDLNTGNDKMILRGFAAGTHISYLSADRKQLLTRTREENVEFFRAQLKYVDVFDFPAVP